ncbi:MAG: sulfurtransferase [Rhodospirillales bacterium]|tara:strand:- start:3655 stop:4617 length:963 start_codon:yes stop_codon:yes gene_type:complete
MKQTQTYAIAITLLIFTSISAYARPLVDTTWLKNNLQNDNLVMIDLRNKIDGGSFKTFQLGHIPGSIHSDYLKDGWRTKKKGVVGLLPTEEEFENLAEKLGVSNNSHVVLIPAGENSTDFGSSARAYWTFKVFGHSNVSILDGGYKLWLQKYPSLIDRGKITKNIKGNFKAKFNPSLYASTTDVAKVSGTESDIVLLDGRNKEQFIGEKKHKNAKRFGHIPGAQLISQAKTYNTASNQLKSKTELKDLFSEITNKPVISYCNTGHWAATNWFALSEVLGNKNVKLYDGSMVEWTTDARRKVDRHQSNLNKIKSFFSDIFG